MNWDQNCNCQNQLHLKSSPWTITTHIHIPRIILLNQLCNEGLTVRGIEPILDGDGPFHIFTEEVANQDCSDHSPITKTENLYNLLFSLGSIVRAFVRTTVTRKMHLQLALIAVGAIRVLSVGLASWYIRPGNGCCAEGNCYPN
jgi:hypothetical protein